MKNGLHRDDNGNAQWYKGGKVHRDDDLPAMIFKDGAKYWVQYASYHRIGNPAVIYADGVKVFFIKGSLYSKKDYWKELGKTYGLIIRDKVRI